MSKVKLHQIIAVTSGKKTNAQQLLTTTHRWVPETLSGLVRTYEPLDAMGEKLPDETKLVQVRVHDAIRKAVSELDDYFNVVNTQEHGNRQAKASIRVGTQIIANDVPVTVLLFLEKQVTDLRTFVQSIPTLPTDKEWIYDRNRNCFVTAPVRQTRTKKVKKALVKYEATKEHPAQTETYDEDVIIGYHMTTHMSGAIRASDKADMLDRINKLSDAIKFAREEANSIEIDERKIGKDILGYIFDKKDEQIERAQS